MKNLFLLLGLMFCFACIMPQAHCEQVKNLTVELGAHSPDALIAIDMPSALSFADAYIYYDAIVANVYVSNQPVMVLCNGWYIVEPHPPDQLQALSSITISSLHEITNQESIFESKVKAFRLFVLHFN